MPMHRKTWFSLPIFSLILFSVSVTGNLARAANPCDIELSQVTYGVGETVSLSVFRLTNPAAVPQSYEWKLWLSVPFLGEYSLVNFGADGSFALPAGFDLDFVTIGGPVQIVTIDGVVFGPGNYEIGCRLVNPITGEEYIDADILSFDVL